MEITVRTLLASVAASAVLGGAVGALATAATTSGPRGPVGHPGAASTIQDHGGRKGHVVLLGREAHPEPLAHRWAAVAQLANKGRRRRSQDKSRRPLLGDPERAGRRTQQRRLGRLLMSKLSATAGPLALFFSFVACWVGGS